LDVQHWHAEWTCSIIIQRGHAVESAAGTSSVDMQRGDMAMKHGHAAWACSKGMQHGDVFTFTQHIHALCSRSMDIQHNHTA
jgi:hypothetical protein